MSRSKFKVSVVVLSKNEGERIIKCLKSVAWADELLVVDNDSSDNTAEIAQNYGARVVSSAIADFAKLRNMGRDITRHPWILYLDADETVTGALQNEIKETIGRFNPLTSPGVYFIKRKNYYLGHPWPFVDKMQRFFWREALIGWQGELHETPSVRGQVSTLDSVLIHEAHRSLAEMVAKTNQWSEVEAKLRFEAHHPPVVGWRFFRVLLTGFTDYYIQQGGWRAGTIGLIESIYQAFSLFITYAKLWEKQQSATEFTEL